MDVQQICDAIISIGAKSLRIHSNILLNRHKDETKNNCSSEGKIRTVCSVAVAQEV